MKHVNALKRNSWLLLAVLALLGMLLVPGQAHAQPVARIPTFARLRLTAATPKILSLSQKARIHLWRPEALPAARAAKFSVKAEPAPENAGKEDVYQRAKTILGGGDVKKVLLKNGRKAFDGYVLSSGRATLPESDLQDELGL